MTVQPTRDQLRALADAATPGPWDYPGTLLGLSCTTVFAGRTHAAYVAAASPENGAFIAAARTALPQLLDQLDRAEAELDSWMTRAYEAEKREYRAEKRIEAVRDVLDTWATRCQTEQTTRALDAIRRALEG